ncbi:hypothetical protein NM208_g8813 [Fusarium decemcellulare]|uniref:Uncharacterized protein n=1 Tax=Fusarium decemcellulare TaxID=57161 RepID=A0ACC1S411_9HYPO|nr:hypothetical protein NM208_g8813 [Fusarium decemcellulare]
MMKHIESGLYQMGGATLNGQDIARSAIIARAKTTQEIMDVLSQDIYARSGVWDLSRVQMIPFICVYRLAHVNEKVMGGSAKYLQEGKESVNQILE